MRRAIPVIALSAAGLTWLLRTQGVIDAGPGDVDVTAGASTTGAATAGAVRTPGESVPTPYGPVQVAALIRDARLTDVEVMQVPNTDANSKRIAAMAVPKLRQEALDRQSAQIDAVAGATFTSEGYRHSLQSALDTAEFTGAANEAAADTVPSTAPPTTAPPSTAPSTTAARATPTSGAGARTAAASATHQYGKVTVSVTVSGGRLTALLASGPTDNPMSKSINDGALPKLRQEALNAQNANIAAVSGATLTSNAFKQSLQAALNNAGM